MLRKVFRIEQYRPSPDETGIEEHSVPAPATDAAAALRHSEVINEIRSVRALIEGRAEEAERVVERFQSQFSEFQKVKAELDVISHAIAETKRELASIHVAGYTGQDMSRVTNELDAVVDDTENATQTILGAVEEIDARADALAASLTSETDLAAARAIQDCVIRIFEACNFQDLTGQRISKVVSALKFIEDHIRRMEDIWGAIEGFDCDVTAAAADADEEDKLLNGPKLEGDVGHVSQNDIDALFD